MRTRPNQYPTNRGDGNCKSVEADAPGSGERAADRPAPVSPGARRAHMISSSQRATAPVRHFRYAASPGSARTLWDAGAAPVARRTPDLVALRAR